jgi:hypothetical protein
MPMKCRRTFVTKLTERLLRQQLNASRRISKFFTVSYCHTGSFCNVLNLGLGAVCAVSAGKVKVDGPDKDDFADAAVSHRTDLSSGLQSDRPRSLGFLVCEADQAHQA